MTILELIFRYGLPGLPVAFALLIMLNSNNPGNNQLLQTVTEINSEALLIMALPLGYLVHQLWMLIFESRWLGLSYSSKKRKVLVHISKITKENRLLKDKELYPVWDTLLYSNSIPPEIRNKDKGMWDFYHANLGNASGLLIGALILLLHLCFGGIIEQSKNLLFILFTAYLIFSFALILKALQTKKLAESLEIHWVDIYFDKHLRTLEDFNILTEIPRKKTKKKK